MKDSHLDYEAGPPYAMIFKITCVYLEAFSVQCYQKSLEINTVRIIYFLLANSMPNLMRDSNELANIQDRGYNL